MVNCLALELWAVQLGCPENKCPRRAQSTWLLFKYWRLCLSIRTCVSETSEWTLIIYGIGRCICTRQKTDTPFWSTQILY